MRMRRWVTVAVTAVLISGLAWFTVERAEVASADTVPLKKLAAAEGITFGTAVSASALKQDTEYAKRLDAEFGSVTPEDAMKWAVVEPEQGEFDWQGADDIVNAADPNGPDGQEVRGHTLVWHSSLPGWLTTGSFSETEVTTLLREHIQTTVGRYAGRVKTWDVVNEPLNNDGTLRSSLWLNRLTDTYIADSFRWAHAADPSAVLYLNEYGAEWSGPKATALYNLVKKLLAEGVPIGGVGFQAHLTGSSRPDGFAAMLRRFADLGVDVAVTELDVRIPTSDPAGTVATTADLDSQARVYGQVVAACLSVPRCRSVTTWGFTDAYSWIPGGYPGWGAADLFDADRVAKPKPAHTTVANTLLAHGRPAGAPVGQWRLDDPEGATVAADTSGYGHDATARGGTMGNTGRVPDVTAFVGNGSTSEVTTTAPVVNTGDSFTVSAWVRMTSTGIPGVIAAQDGAVRSAFYLMYQTSTNRWEFTVPSVDGSTVEWLTARSVTVPALNTWTHLTGVYDKTAHQLRLYVNGVLEGNRNTVTAWASSGPFHIGRSFSGGRFAGAMSDVRVWNRALPESEVPAVSDRTVAWWGFDGTATDSSPFGRATSLTSSGTGYTTDRNGALSLTGTGSADGYGPSLLTEQSYTVAAWVKLTAKDGSRVVISQAGAKVNAFYLQYHQTYNRWSVLVPAADVVGPTWQYVLSTEEPALNTWTHLAAAYDAQAEKLSLYVNGAPQGNPVAAKSWSSAGRVHIGSSGTGSRFIGAIDDVRAYASALSVSEIRALATV
ncbi:hypothetical protein GCM10010112_92780 [Actinoplanes lobatus]|uniref:Beta-xylanase n=1 Tax=Actinoplanes lobatus TaxID=113568 RepID=A0A7W7HJV4_9ACTN|nr:endo-1,4-beta-xylanase [Actinoplanes lobatus]MBB4751880.1 GH35 family endo-1,4-beta-xylanase [Actinoplanes lobatus]GGN99193.1 hypothetical protein GCM10010112_92780 [Actinoplanes lobatus]GIE46312.1 hypothetical protein Alo02nite_92100 [Actinoplanes lobatus]